MELTIGALFVPLQRKGEEATDKIDMRDAAMFPLYASGGLFGLYLFFKVAAAHSLRVGVTGLSPLPQYVPKEYVNMIISVLFFGLGVSALARATRCVCVPLCQYPASSEAASLQRPGRSTAAQVHHLTTDTLSSPTDHYTT